MVAMERGYQMWRVFSIIAIASGFLQYAESGFHWQLGLMIFNASAAALRGWLPAIQIDSDLLTVFCNLRRTRFALSALDSVQVGCTPKSHQVILRKTDGKNFEVELAKAELLISYLSQHSTIPIHVAPPAPRSRHDLPQSYRGAPKPSSWFTPPVQPWDPFAWLSLVYDAKEHSIHPPEQLSQSHVRSGQKQG